MRRVNERVSRSHARVTRSTVPRPRSLHRYRRPSTRRPAPSAAASKLTKIAWAKFSGEDSAPTAKDKHRRWGEIAAAAALEGAVFGGTRAVVDRAGAKAFARITGRWPR